MTAAHPLAGLTADQREVLGAIAWTAIREGLAGGAGRRGVGRLQPMRVDAGSWTTGDGDWLRRPGATFVTLHRDGELRGCIGTLAAAQPIGQDVADHAFGAAFEDPRFRPLSEGEYGGLELHISVLGQPEPMSAGSRQAVINALRPGVDGLVLRCGGLRATFLPAVWQSLPVPADFVSHLMRKAGLAADGWPEGMAAERYGVEEWQVPIPMTGS